MRRWVAPGLVLGGVIAIALCAAGASPAASAFEPSPQVAILENDLLVFLTRDEATACASALAAFQTANHLDALLKRSIDSVTSAEQALSETDTAATKEFVARFGILAGNVFVTAATLPTVAFKGTALIGDARRFATIDPEAAKSLGAAANALATFGYTIIQNIRTAPFNMWDKIDNTLGLASLALAKYDAAVNAFKVALPKMGAGAVTTLGALLGFATVWKSFEDAKAVFKQQAEDANTAAGIWDTAYAQYAVLLKQLKAAVNSMKTALADCPKKTVTFDVRAYIDGHSDLILTGRTAQWHHFDWAAPGRWQGHNAPTVINGASWLPTWPSPGQNLNCNCSSGLFKSVSPAVPKSGVMSYKKISCRDSCSAHYSGGTLTIDFNDDPTAFPADYEVIVTIKH